MRLLSLEVDNYRRLRNSKIEFQYTSKDFVVPNLFGTLGITLVAGPNGSGKTSLLSYIANIFHNLERGQDLIQGAFKLRYKDTYHKVCVLSRERNEEHVFLQVENEPRRQIIYEPGWRKKDPLPKSYIFYSDAEEHLPSAVIISAFSLHAEYPSPHQHNYIGDRRVRIYDLKNLYGDNHYGFPSFSGAIRELMLAAMKRDSSVVELERILNARFTGEVLVRRREWRYEDDTQKMPSYWIPFSPEVYEAEMKAEIYLNDFRLKRISENDFLQLSNMSSGQKILFIRLLTILGEAKPGTLVLLEEPEMHLDPAWSHQLISLLLAFFKNLDSHLVVATHSFSLVNAVPSNCVLVANQGQFSAPDHPTLLANQPTISHELYRAEPHSVENAILRYAQNTSSKEELVKLVNLLGMSAARFDVYAMYKDVVEGERGAPGR